MTGQFNYMKILVILCLFMTATAAESVTTRLDNEFFAFNPTPVLAIKASGKWISAPRLFTLGSKGKKFTIDARGAVDLVPIVCRQLFSSDLPDKELPRSMPKSVLDGDSTQVNYFWGQECVVFLWMTGQRDPYFIKNFKHVLPINNHKSASIGLIEFRHHNGQVTAIEFAILVEDASFSEYSDSINKCNYPSETKINSKLIISALGNNAEQCVTFPYLAKYSNPEADLMPWYHAGVDLKANYQPAFSVVDGIVVVDCERGQKEEDTACTDSMGIVMLETEINGSKARVNYVHMSQSFVTKGRRVTVGMPIGITGNRFNGDPNGAGEPHLHIEVRPGYNKTAAVGFKSCSPDNRCDTKAKVQDVTLDPISLVQLERQSMGYTSADNAELPIQMPLDEQNAFRLWLSQNTRFRPAVLTDCLCDEDLPYIRKAYANHHPYYAAGDFNNDGKRDFAVIVIDRSTLETEPPPGNFNSSVVVFSRSKSSNALQPFPLPPIGLPQSTLLFLSRETGKLAVGQWEGEASLIVFIANRYAYLHRPEF